MQAPQTIADRLIVHLSRYLPYWGSFVCPREMTQDGISETLGASRGYVAIELKRMQKSGYVQSALARVVDGRRRMKVYAPTVTGVLLATQIATATNGGAVLRTRNDNDGGVEGNGPAGENDEPRPGGG